MNSLAAARSAITQRQVDHKHEDSLTSAFYVVEAMDADALAAILRETLNRPLCREDADVVQMAAAKLGVTVGWRHYKLIEDVWEEGRGG